MVDGRWLMLNDDMLKVKSLKNVTQKNHFIFEKINSDFSYLNNFKPFHIPFPIFHQPS
jgi:hypothetical protein